MHAWAGRGVAMGNADLEARAAADEVTLSKEEDGLALVLERLLAGQTQLLLANGGVSEDCRCSGGSPGLRTEVRN